MDKSARELRPDVRTVGVIDVMLEPARKPVHLAVSFAIAGRTSPLVLSWPLTQGTMEDRVLVDLLATVSRQLTDVIVTMVGIQEVTPLA